MASARWSLVVAIGIFGITSQSSAQMMAPVPRGTVIDGWYGYGPRIAPWYGAGFGYGYGPWGWGTGSVWNTGFIGSVPGVFWFNGINMYGPPLPALGPIPGQMSYSGYGLGGGIYGAQKDLPVIVPKGNGPRFATRDVKRHFEQVKADPFAAIDRAYRDRQLVNPYVTGSGLNNVPYNRLRLFVTVPADAQVWLDDQPTTSTGTRRVYETPILPPGRLYPFRVTVKSNGTTTTQIANGCPGELVQVRFDNR